MNFNYAYVKAKHKVYATLTAIGGASAQPDDFSDRHFKYQFKYPINVNSILIPYVVNIGQRSIKANIYYLSKAFFRDYFSEP